MTVSASFFAFAVVAASAAVYLVATPNQEPTRGTSEQWQSLCQTKKFSCTLATVQDSVQPSVVSYEACGFGKCFRVTCNAAEPEALCAKTALPAIKPAPRKLQTVIGSIL